MLRSVAIVAIAIVAYVLLAIFIFAGFYASHEAFYDRYAETGLTAFKAAFWAAFSLHAIATVAAAAIVARLLRGPVLFSIVITVAVLVAFSLPLLVNLSYWNSCFGVDDFPLKAANCG